MNEPQSMVYVGPAGAGLGFQLSGMTVAPCDSAEQLVTLLRRYKEGGQYKIIFVDEGLAEPVLTEVEKLNEDTVPAIVLLTSPAKPINLTQQKMNNLVVKAVGSDIFG